MCTVQSIKDAIRENCQSLYDMESTDIDRVLQTLPFSGHESLFDQPPLPKRPYPFCQELYLVTKYSTKFYFLFSNVRTYIHFAKIIFEQVHMDFSARNCVKFLSTYLRPYILVLLYT